MFRELVKGNPAQARQLVQLHPSQLSALLEEAWERRFKNTNVDFGHPRRRSDLNGFFSTWGVTPVSLGPGFNNPFAVNNPVPQQVAWPHLIYAYMIENTRVFEVFRRVLYEFFHGEKLGVPSVETLKWLRATEELFFRDPAPFSVTALTSRVRPDGDAIRRNAYFRMFGMDLNHGAEENKPYPFVKAEAANSEFATTIEEFLREVWVAMENINNSNGAKPTDDAKINDLAKKVRDMLVTRRQSGNLSREEFVAVATMSWFHLTVESNLPIIEELRAQAPSAEQRLFKIAQRVGVPAHGLAENYFDIADSISLLLIFIEELDFSNANTNPAASFYTPGTAAQPNPVEQAARTAIRHWPILTGRPVKQRLAA